MSKYEIVKYISMDYTFYLIRNVETGEFFGGYDFMGSADWTNNLCAYEMDEQEALQIKADLEAADADDQPETEKEDKPMTRYERVNKAIEMTQAPMYRKAHDKVLAAEESRESLTITLNATELEILRMLVSSKIGKEHETWYNITHDSTITTDDMAYELAGSILREDRLQRLLEKLH